MDDSKFLITGANGQLGLALQEKYPNARATDSKDLDIAAWESVKDFDWGNVTVILNAAGYTNVDGAETPDGRAAAWKVNAAGTANLVRIALEKNLTLVHISTDYVFDGTLDNHSEDEPFSPLSVYGASKAAGDTAVGLLPKHYILRTSWVIGEGKNFVQTMLELGKKGVEPKVVSDQIGRLSFTSELVRGIDHLLSAEAEPGTYNLTNGGEPASWADITRQIFQDAGFSLQVTDITTEEYFKDKPLAAPRPHYSALDLSKITATGFTPKDWHEDLAEYVKKEMSR
jgi:dTDP-4-dehydrorhamnose 3,5-epimerase